MLYFSFYGFIYVQYLFVPSKCDEITVTSKNYHFLRAYCPTQAEEPGDNAYWTLSGHREQLYDYDTVDRALRRFWSFSDARETNYDIAFVYDWYAFKNKIDSGDFYDYFDMNIDGTYQVEISSNNNGTTSDDSNTPSFTYLSYAPNDIGTKTTFVTQRKIDLLDIFGLAGGMYSTIEQILTYFTVAIIWGFGFGCCTFGGVANEAGPDGLIRQQLEGFLKARDETIVELTQRIVELEERVGVTDKEQDIGRSPTLTNVSSNQKKRTDVIYKRARKATSPMTKTAVPSKASPNMKPMDLDGVAE